MNTFGLSAAFESWYGAIITGSLMFLSVYVMGLIILRAIFFMRMKVDSQRLMEELSAGLSTNNVRFLGQFKDFKQNDAPVKILIGTALANPQLTTAEQSELFNVVRIRQRERMTRGLSIFGTISTIAPFLGLLGTVLGIVEAFNVLSENGSAGPNVLAAGIGAALWTTAVGLIVAIPSVIAYNIFKGKAKDILTDMEVVSRELMIIMKTDHSSKLKSLAGK